LLETTALILSFVSPATRVLVGNKCDLGNERQVSTEQGKALAAAWGCPFMEASAKETIQNKEKSECFHEVLREICRTEARPAKKRGKFTYRYGLARLPV
jgi:GTPase SAR1 family protein